MRKVMILTLMVLLAAAPAHAAPPSNDSPGQATVISSFPATIEGGTTDATTGPFEEECLRVGAVATSVALPVNAVWYRLDLPEDIERIDIRHDDDAEVVLWLPVRETPMGDPILTRDRCAYRGVSSNEPQTSTIYMAVGSMVGGAPASFSISVEIVHPIEITVPPNDAPYRATKISSLPYQVEQDTRGANFDVDPQGCQDGAYVWYAYTPDVDARLEVVVSTVDESLVTASVYELGAEVRTLGCDSRSGAPAVVTTDAAAGIPLLIGIGSQGLLGLSVHEVGPPPPPVLPDDRTNAVLLPLGATLTYDTTGATLEPGEPTSCGAGGSVWFELPAHARGAVATFTGDVSVATIAGDSVLSCSASGAVSVPAEAAVTHLQLRSASPAVGKLSLRFESAFGRQVSGASPFSAGCGDTSAINFVGSEVEVSQTIDPHDPQHVLMTWQQDRYGSQGGSRGIGAAVSFDGGETWSNSTLPGITQCSGGVFARATDPWAAIDADGVAYVMSLGYNPGPSAPIFGSIVDNFTNLANTVLLSRSPDRGRTWDAPVVVAASPGILFNDKEALTAGPTTPGLLYAVWDLYPTSAAVPVFARSEDGGQTWTPPVPLPITGGGAGDQIAVLDDGTLVDIGARGSMQSITSHDRGVTWSSPRSFAPAGSFEGPPGVRGGAYIPSVSTDGRSIFVSWSDTVSTRFARTDDAGATWHVSTAGQAVGGFPSRSTTAVAATDAGRIGVMTYSVDEQYEAHLVLDISIDGGATWTEQPVTDPFDMTRAPVSSGRGYFLGDYFGLSASGDELLAAFAAVPSGDQQGISNVYSLRVTP